jgi:hypothetical protein
VIEEIDVLVEEGKNILLMVGQMVEMEEIEEIFI